MTERLTIAALHDRIGIVSSTPGYGQAFGSRSRAALAAALSNPAAPALTPDDFKIAADRLGVPVGHMRGIRKVEAPRGAYDDQGRPTPLYERHVFRRNCITPGQFDKAHPDLSGGPYGPGGYGSFSGQYDKIGAAIALDPEAAFRAVSWGAFQVLGENAHALGYASAFAMVEALTTGEAAHLDCFVRFVEANKLVDELRACRASDPKSCQPFVAKYNGPGYRLFQYDTKLAAAIAG